MILIFSERANLSTRFVLAYLHRFNKQFDVFLEDDLIEFNYYFGDNQRRIEIYKNKNFLIDLEDVKSVWYYRTDIRVRQLGDGVFEDKDSNEYSLWHVKTRYSHIANLFHSKKCLGVFGQGNFNKIDFLDSCNKLGIKTPRTLITDKKTELLKFYEYNDKKIITKSLAYPFRELIERDNKYLVRQGYTTIITEEQIKILPDTFDLSLFQEKVEKLYEIRTFYLDGSCYSQAIFSQMNQESSLDYRLGYETNMRCCNINLPSKIEDQVIILMKKLGLNFGSLDIIYSTSKEYIFLEVNPSGQFGAVTEVINGNFEYHIAKYLAS